MEKSIEAAIELTIYRAYVTKHPKTVKHIRDLLLNGESIETITQFIKERVDANCMPSFEILINYLNKVVNN